MKYDAETGLVDAKCWDNGKGYLRTMHEGRLVMVHRLAWYLSYGEWPQGQIDHINRDSKDNRLCNLRVVTQSQNMHNTGRLDVRKQKNRWRARITVNRERKFLGSFLTREEAEQSVRKAREAI